MIKVYAPTTESMEEETHQFYDELNSVKHQCKDHEIIMIMGYLNAKKGRERVGASVGSRVHGDRNDNGDVWIEWCKENDREHLVPIALKETVQCIHGRAMETTIEIL